jgi:hypothetical protein
VRSPSAASSAQGGQDRAGLDDRVHALQRSRAVGRAAGHLDLRPHEALVGDDQLELGRLGHDRGVGLHRAEHLLHAEAGVLLVGHGGDHDVAAQPGPRGLAAGEQRRREAGLHVIGAATGEPVTLQARRVRVGHARHPDRVGVRAQQQRPPATGPAGSHDDARASRRRLQHVHLQPGRARPLDDEARHLGLPGTAGHQRRVDGVDGDHPGGELDQVRVHRAPILPARTTTARLTCTLPWCCSGCRCACTCRPSASRWAPS